MEINGETEMPTFVLINCTIRRETFTMAHADGGVPHSRADTNLPLFMLLVYLEQRPLKLMYYYIITRASFL